MSSLTFTYFGLSSKPTSRRHPLFVLRRSDSSWFTVYGFNISETVAFTTVWPKSLIAYSTKKHMCKYWWEIPNDRWVKRTFLFFVFFEENCLFSLIHWERSIGEYPLGQGSHPRILWQSVKNNRTVKIDNFAASAAPQAKTTHCATKIEKATKLTIPYLQWLIMHLNLIGFMRTYECINI